MDSTFLKKQIGLKIKQLRTIKGWSREQMADKLEMSVAGYGSIERGETDLCITRLTQVAETFEITLVDLLGLTEKMVFNFGVNSEECNNNWSINTPIDNKELKHELEKLQLINQAQTNEIENLKQQVLQLHEIIALLKDK